MTEAPEKTPRHVAVIMDGNGRWARRRGLPRQEGHRRGADSAKAVTECCGEVGIPCLTLFAFSTENWSRPQDEVDFLMDHLRQYLADERDGFVENDIRFRTIGRIHKLPEEVQEEVRRTEEATSDCDRLTLNVALSFGGRQEITDAARRAARRVQRGELDPEDIDESMLDGQLDTAELPELDLLVRTGGERRVSNFLLWEMSYAELYFTETLWPDFREDEFMAALHDFADRERKFGSVPETSG